MTRAFIVILIVILVLFTYPPVFAQTTAPIGRSGQPVPTQPNPTFSNPLSHVAPMATPNVYYSRDRSGRTTIIRPDGSAMTGGTQQRR